MEHWAGVDGVAGFRNGDRTAAHFHSPRGMCGDGRGNLVIVDSGNACLRRINASGAQVDPPVARNGRSFCALPHPAVCWRINCVRGQPAGHTLVSFQSDAEPC